MIPSSTAPLGHKSDTLNNNLALFIFFKMSAVMPKKRGGDSQIIKSNFPLIFIPRIKEVITNVK